VLQLTTEPLVAVLLTWATGHMFPEIPAGDTMYFIAAGLSTLLFLLAVAIVTYRSKPVASAVLSKHYIVLAFMVGLCLAMSYIVLWIILRSGMPISFIHVILVLSIYSMPIFIFFVFERFQEHAFAEVRTLILRSQIAQNEKQFELMEAHQLEIRKLKHDFTGQLMTMQLMAERSSNLELTSYLSNYTESVSKTLEKTITGLSSVDAVIESKRNQAEELGVQFEVLAPALSEIKINPIHLNNILINALDNAIEACMALPDDAEKHIELGLKNESEYLFIRVINTAPPVAIEEGSFPATTKEDKSSHGIGLESVSDSVKKYRGILTLDYKENLFYLLIRMRNMAPEDE